MSGALREVLAKFSIEVDTRALEQGAQGVHDLNRGLEQTDQRTRKASDRFGEFKKQVGMAAVAGGALLTKGLYDATKEMLELGGALDDTSARLGVNVEELQRWQFAANLSGISTDEMNGALQKFQKNLADAADGSKPAVDAMKKLGVEVKDSSGNIRPTTDILRDVARGVADIEDPAKRTQALMEAFGKSGANLGPLFADGAEGVDQLLKELEKTGGLISEDTVKALAASGDELDKFDASARGLKAKLVVELLPTITRMIEGFRSFVTTLSTDENAMERFKSVLQTVAVAGAIAGLVLLAPYAGLALAITVAILVLDDLKTAMKGGDSVATRLLDKLFGKGAGKSIFKSLNEDWANFRADVENLGFVGAVGEAFQNLGADLVKFFVEDVPAAIDQAQTAVMEGTGSIGEKIVTGIVAGLKGALLGSLDLISPETAKFGKAIIDGIVKGITDNLPAIGGAIGTVTNLVKENLNTDMEVQSPSKWTKRFAGHVFSPLVTEAPNWAAKAGAASQGVAMSMQGGLGRSLSQSNAITINAQGRPASEVRRMARDTIDDLGTSALDYLEATA